MSKYTLNLEVSAEYIRNHRVTCQCLPRTWDALIGMYGALGKCSELPDRREEHAGYLIVVAFSAESRFAAIGRAYFLAETLEQDCVALWDHDKASGILVGPMAHTFNAGRFDINAFHFLGE